MTPEQQQLQLWDDTGESGGEPSSIARTLAIKSAVAAAPPLDAAQVDLLRGAGLNRVLVRTRASQRNVPEQTPT